MKAITERSRPRRVAPPALLAVASALAHLAPGDGAAQSATANGRAAAERFVGAWELVRWTSVSGAGVTTYPFGENAQGQISYSATGRMGAHLMQPPADPSDAPAQHIAYWGTYTLDVAAGTVTHHVIGADRPNWIGSDQVRRFRFESDDVLVLSLGSQDLVWRRVR